MDGTVEKIGHGGSGDAYRGGAIERQPSDGRFISGRGLTHKQRSFVSAYVLNGGNGTTAAETAGYSHPRTDAYHLLRLPHVIDAIRQERGVSIETEGACMAWATMQAIMRDPQYSGAVKFQAAKWTLEQSGHGLAAQRAQLGLPSDKPLSEMNLQELEAFITAGGVALQALQQQRANTIDVTPVAPDTARKDEASD